MNDGDQTRVERTAVERTLGNPFVWAGLALAIFSFNVIRSMSVGVPTPPKPLLQLPQFELRDQIDRPFGSNQLKGKIWVANFVFTSCPTMCPKLSEHMQRVKHRLRGMGSAVHLVSFSVDPQRDTPEVLARYAAKYGANPDFWSFLTGDLSAVEETVIAGFKMPIVKDDESLFSITHGQRFVLVDSTLQIRGFYETSDEELDRMIRDVGLLMAADQRSQTSGQRAALTPR